MAAAEAGVDFDVDDTVWLVHTAGAMLAGRQAVPASVWLCRIQRRVKWRP